MSRRATALPITVPRSARRSRRADPRRLVSMDLEEHTLPPVGEHCEECGAELTDAEKQAVLESGGPVLCSVHADDVVPIAEEDPGTEPPAAA